MELKNCRMPSSEGSKYFRLLIPLIILLFQTQMTSKRKLQAAFDFNEMRLTSLIFKEWRAVNDRESRQKFKKDLEAIKHHRRYFFFLILR